jgi:energy-coupling factor transport system substrate-specific component
MLLITPNAAASQHCGIIRQMIENPVTGDAETVDGVVAGLQALRIEAGGVTYDEIASRITQARLAHDVPPAAARIARSTVYDAFRTGRARLNAELVAEIVVALGADDTAANDWRQRAIRARLKRALPAADFAPQAGGRAIMVFVMIASVGLNLFGNATAARVGAPLFLDMIGTAVVSIAYGPWYGAVVGLSSNVLASLSNTPQAAPFALVNIAGALVWGYGVRKWALGRSPLRLISLNVIAAIACTAVAAPIIVLGFEGATANDVTGGLFAMIQGYGASLWQAVLASNIVVSLVDKQIAGFVGLGVAIVLARHPSTAVIGLKRPELWKSP